MNTEHQHLKPDGNVEVHAAGVRVSIPAALVLALATLCGGGVLGASIATKDEGKPVASDDVREIKADIKIVLSRLSTCEDSIKTLTGRVDALNARKP